MEFHSATRTPYKYGSVPLRVSFTISLESFCYCDKKTQKQVKSIELETAITTFDYKMLCDGTPVIKEPLHSNRLPIYHCFDCSDIDITCYTKLYQRYPIDVLWLYEGFDSVLQILIYQCRRWIKFILKRYWRTDYYRWILCKTQSVNIAVSAFSSLK